MTDRSTIRCANCSLNQYLTASGICRRCGKAFSRPQLIESTAATTDGEPASNPSMFFTEKIGRTLLEYRHARHLSQRQLAEIIDVPRTYISKCENGNSLPTIVSLRRFAKAFDVTLFAFLGCAEAELFMKEIAPYVHLLSRAQRRVVLNAASLCAKEKEN